jgi:hypothetical protein
VRERAKELGTTVVVNHEARGAGGAPMTFRMSSPNSQLVEALAEAPGAFADSSSEASFEALPKTPTSPHSSRLGYTATTPLSWRTAPFITAPSTTQPISVQPPFSRWVTPPSP